MPPKVPDRDDVTGEPLVQRADDTEKTIRMLLALQFSTLLTHTYMSSGANVQMNAAICITDFPIHTCARFFYFSYSSPC